MLRNTSTGDNDVNGIPTADSGFGNTANFHNKNFRSKKAGSRFEKRY